MTRIFISLGILLLCLSELLYSQTQVVTTPRISPQASISQTVGITEITIAYSRPAVRGREIWGKLVPFGMVNPGWGTATSAPWRAGANENTTISFSTDVIFNGVNVKAGTYGLYMALEENGNVELMLSSNSNSWGSYFYDEDEIVARASTSWEEHRFTEYLEYTFNDFTENSVYCSLNWGDKSIPFEVGIDIEKTVVQQLRNDLRGPARFSYLGPMEAANWCVAHNTNLEEALSWAELAANMNKQFSTLKVKADALKALGRDEESMKTMKEGYPLASVYQLHGYGRQLVLEGKIDEAMEVFTMNQKLHPDIWPVNYGLARGYSAKGDFKKALDYMDKAKKNCPDEINRERIEVNIERLTRGEDIN